MLYFSEHHLNFVFINSWRNIHISNIEWHSLFKMSVLLRVWLMPNVLWKDGMVWATFCIFLMNITTTILVLVSFFILIVDFTFSIPDFLGRTFDNSSNRLLTAYIHQNGFLIWFQRVWQGDQPIEFSDVINIQNGFEQQFRYSLSLLKCWISYLHPYLQKSKSLYDIRHQNVLVVVLDQPNFMFCKCFQEFLILFWKCLRLKGSLQVRLASSSHAVDSSQLIYQQFNEHHKYFVVLNHKIDFLVLES